MKRYIRETWPRVSEKKAKGVWGWRIDARKMRNGVEVGKGDLWRADKGEPLELARTIGAKVIVEIQPKSISCKVGDEIGKT